MKLFSSANLVKKMEYHANVLGFLLQYLIVKQVFFFQCSKSCGGGVQSRKAWCVDYLLNKLPNKQCNITKRGPLRRSCNEIGCPQWETSEWSMVSMLNKPISNFKAFPLFSKKKKIPVLQML